MLRELFASKSLIAALIVCGLVIVGIHLWSQHEHSKLRHEEAETRRFIQQVAAEKKAATTRVEELSVVPQPHEVKRDAQAAHDNFARDTDDETPEVDTATKAIEVGALVAEEFVAHEEPPEPPRMSLFGFGVYPEIPPDYREPDVWERIEELALTDPSGAERQELMARVCIELWGQGHYAEGVVYKSKTGLIYPLYPNTAYIEWDVWEEEDGTLSRYPARVMGGSGIDGYEEDFAEGIIPPHITVIDYEAAGIDPYQFLDFQHE